MKFSKHNIADIPFEESHGVSNTKQILFDQNAAESNNWENVTKGILPAGGSYDWHKHEGVDEMFIVTKGKGKFYCEKDVTEYKADDVVMIRANTMHKIEAVTDTEGFFIRIKV